LFTGLIESGKPEMVTKMLRVIQETEFDEFCKWVYWLSKSHPQYQYTEETTLTEN
jgi:hypothetical protein